MDPQEQLEVGKAAEDFLRYTEEHPYFEDLLERVKLELARQILDLRPFDTEHFTVLRSRMIGVGDVMDAVRGDIYLGGEAFKQLEGTIDENKGIL